MDANTTTTDVSGVIDLLETIRNRGHSYHRVYRDWIDLMLCALQRDDDQYLEILDRYDEHDRDRGDRDADIFSKAFGELQKECARTGLDVLGDVYEEFGMQSDHFGQHFTPHAVSFLLVQLQGSSTHDVETISDPACGSGRLLLYKARNHSNPTCVGQDKDHTCAKMTALNFCLFNLDGYAIAGDSLTMDYERVWKTTSTPTGGTVRELTGDDLDAFEDESKPEPVPSP